MSQHDLLRERLREAALVLREVRIERDALQAERDEPIALIGMGCRLPGGVNSPAAYWELLSSGRDTVTSLLPRWELVGSHPDEQAPRWASLLSEPVDEFDPGFFGISPREARTLDPQHRLLLEVSWAALEDAGIVPASLEQSRTGVFIGACAHDYSHVVAQQRQAAQDAYATTGNMLSIAAGRLSYTLGLQGPSLTVDTACSSSLLAIHLACRSLRARESSLALAGGVNMLLSPDTMTALARTQALSPEGRCRTFDASASGYVRGEGCGIVVLKRLSDASRDGDRIWALIRGSAANQDGRSTGLTAPNVLAQQALLQEALKNARVPAEAIGYVETHGTGTSLGDPIEVEALREVVGRPRSDGTRCILGAVKTNIGHLEGAAGVASVIKAALVLSHQRIPQNLNFRTLNAHIELEGSSLQLATEPVLWPRGDRPRFAGVSGFGLSGTNVHVVLEEAPVPARTELAAGSADAAPILPFVLSGRTQAALRAQAAQLQAHLSSRPELPLVDVAAALACKRTHFEHRAAVIAQSRAQLQEALGALSEGQPTPRARTGLARRTGKLGFLFTGQGSQRPAMGRALCQRFPCFEEALGAACAQLDPLLPRPLREVMLAEPGTPEAQLLEQTAWTQPALFALQVALYRLLESLGVTPELVLGHSVGELAAAHVAGVLSLKDASRLVVARGRLMQELPPGGAMVALQATAQEVEALLAGKESRLAIAAHNGPHHTVISGEEEEVLQLARHFEALGRKGTRLAVSHAFHSPRMDAMAGSFGQVAAELSYKEPQIPVIASLTGEPAADGELGRAEYWVKQTRAAVQFQHGVESLDTAGVRTYLELGPRGVLSAMAPECLREAAPADREFIAALRAEGEESAALLQALARLHVRGIGVDFGALFRPLHPRHVELPTYPFERQRYWLERPVRAAGGVRATGLSKIEHPLLSAAVALAERDGYLLIGDLAASAEPWAVEHRVFSAPLLPGTGLLEWALVAAQALGLSTVEDLSLVAPLRVPESGSVQVQLAVHEADARGCRAMSISSRPAGSPLQAPWTSHATGVLGPHVAGSAAPDGAAEWPPVPAAAVDLAGLYELFQKRGLDYGAAFRGLRAVWKEGPGVVYTHAVLPQALQAEAARYLVHPALLDAALHAVVALLPSEAGDAVYVPVSWQRARLFAAGPSELRARVQLHGELGEQVSLSLVAFDGRGEPVLQIERFVGQRVRPEQLRRTTSGLPLHALQWLPVAASTSPERAPQGWVLGGAGGLAQRLHWPAVDGSQELAERLQRAAAPAQLLLDATAALAPSGLPAVHARAQRLLGVLQTLLQDERLAATELILLTQDAVSTGPEDGASALDQAPLWGLFRSARSEHAARRLRLLDVTADSAPQEIQEALALLGEPELVVRAGRLLTPRLVEVGSDKQTLSLPEQAPSYRLDLPVRGRLDAQARHIDKPVLTPPRRLRTDGTALVTGGTGELGALLARHLVARHGLRHLLLVSRQGMQAPGAAALAADLQALGATVHIASCDVSDAQALAALLTRIPDSAPLRAVFHCAAVLEDGLLSSLTPESLDRVFAAKVDAAWHLHTQTQTADLDAFVLFSSVSGTLGAPGQASYAAANTFLDALAANRQSAGLPGQSLAWGLWQLSGRGLAGRLTAQDRARIERQGLRALSPAEALELLDASLERPEALLLPMSPATERLAQAGDAAPPLLRALAPAQPPRLRAAESSPARKSGVAARLATLPAAEQQSAVLDLVRQEVAVVLGLASSGALTPEQPLKELGLDSLMTVELRDRLHEILGVRFELSALFRIPNLQSLAEELIRLLAEKRRAAPVPAPVPAAAAPAESSAAQRPVTGPLSAGQQRLYFLDRALELRHTYNLVQAIRLQAPLDLGALQQAVEHMIARHDQLRVCFIEKDGLPRQRVLPWVEPPIEELALDLAPDSAATGDRDAALRQLIDSESRRPFDLSRAPLFRLLYIRLGGDESALVLIWHHIITDGTSTALCVNELSETYQAIQSGRQLAVAAAPSYLAYATRQAEWLKTAASDAQRAFWRAKLEGLPALDLPADRPAPRVRTERGSVVRFELSAELTQAIEALARTTRSTPFVLFSAAWSALLSRYSGQQDFVIGTLTASRHDSSVRELVGFLVNSLPIRCPLQGSPTGLEYITRLHDEILAALDHQELPLDEIIRAVAPVRQPGLTGSPLFRTCLSYDDWRIAADSFAGIAAAPLVDSVNKVGGTSKFDLLLTVVRRAQGCAAAIEFTADLFDAGTVQRYAEHFVTLLTHLVNEPQRRLHELPLLTEAERRQLLIEWNDTTAEFPKDTCIHQQFEAQVERTPDTLAVFCEGEQLSYRELNARANQLAHRLRPLGVAPDRLVALCVERSLDLVIGVLAVLKAGGAYVPIDPDYPAERIDFMLKDCGPAVILTQRPLVPRLPPTAAPILCLDDPATLDGQPVENPTCTATPTSLAYVIYTSGSTGRPKGVLMEHRPVMNLLPALNRRAWGSEPLRAAMIAPIVFDMSVKPLFGALLYGHSLYIADKQTRRDGGALLSFYQRHRIAWSDCTPSIVAMLIEAGLPTCQPLELRVLLCGGEALPTAMLAGLYAPGVHRSLQVINVYGPTEACVNVNANPVEARTLDTSRPVVPLGRPFENVKLYVLDAHLQPVPVGIPGELLIGGVGLARGYLNRPELTAERFIPDPFSTEPGARLYKTGDLVRYLQDGRLEFLGRMDHQVKIRGHRIELGEIEAVVASQADVAGCVVLAREDSPGPSGKRLVAYVVPQSGRRLDADGLRAHAAKLLPEPMLPAAYVFLSALPLTRNGKVDRGALPAPASEHRAETFVPPSGPIEGALADLFASVLGLPRLGRHDDFFALGGDSLLAVRAVARAQQAGFSVTVKQLFAGPTITKLAAALAGSAQHGLLTALQEGPGPGAVVLVPGSGGTFYRAHDIARALQVSTPIFGLLSPIVSGAPERPDSIEQLAALYVRELLERIPQGPVVLVGYSSGGPVAVEIAAQLLSKDRAVERVILLDSRLRPSGARVEVDAETALHALLETLGLPPTRLRGSGLAESLAEVAALLAPGAEARPGMLAFLGSLLENAQAISRMLAAWRPHLPQVPVHLLRVEGDEGKDPDYGWGQHGPLASLKAIPGQHYSILRAPHLDTTMQAVRSLLNQASLQRR